VQQASENKEKETEKPEEKNKWPQSRLTFGCDREENT